MTLEAVSVVCEVCDQEGTLQEYRGHLIHEDCAPSHWRKDREELLDFMERVMAKGRP